MAWIGLLPVLAGIAAIVWKSKQYQKIVFLFTLAAALLQLFSYAAFSLMLSGNIPFLWILPGLAAGALLGKRQKIYLSEFGDLLYRQNLILAVAYLVMMIACQATTAILTAYLPLLLYLTGTVSGVLSGFLLVLLFRSRPKKEKPAKPAKEKKTPKPAKEKKAPKPKKEKKAKTAPAVLALALCLSCFVPVGTVSASPEEPAATEAEGEGEAAAEPAEPTVMDIEPSEINITIPVGDNTAYDELSGGKLGTSLKFDVGTMGNSENGRAFQGGAVRYFNYYRVPAAEGNIYQYGVDGSTVRVYYGFEIYNGEEGSKKDLKALLEKNAKDTAANGYTVDTVELGSVKAYRTYEVSGAIKGVTYMGEIKNTLFTMVYTYAPPTVAPIEEVQIYTPDEMTPTQLDALFSAWIKRTVASKEFKEQLNWEEEGEETEHAEEANLEKESGKSEKAGASGGIVQLFTNGKNLLDPVPVEPAAAGESALLGGVLSIIGVVLLSLKCTVSKGVLIIQDEEEELPPEPVDTRAGLGMRREDGRLWTKNHGWQSKDNPGLQVEGLDRSIKNLHGELAKYMESQDKQLADIVREEITRCERDRIAWAEDYKIAEKKPFVKKGKENDEEIIIAEPAAPKPWNYDRDLGAAAARGRLEEIVSEKKEISSMVATRQILKRASDAAETGPSPGAHLLEAPTTFEILRNAGVEEALNAELIKCVGKVSESAKKAISYEKEGMEKLPDALKAMTEAAEAYAEKALAAAKKK